MARYPHLWNRNGNFYFRLAVPAALVWRFGREDLTYSLKTKSYTEAKVRCGALLQVAEWLFEKVKLMPRLTAPEIKAITQRYFAECLKRMEVQFDTADHYSSALSRESKRNQGLAAGLNGLDLTGDANRLDFLMPDNFQYGSRQEPLEPTGMRLGFNNHFSGDSDAVTQHIIAANSLGIEQGSLTYKTLKNAAERAINELVRLRNARIGMDDDIEPNDEFFAPRAVQQTALTAAPFAPASSRSIREIYNDYLAEVKPEPQRLAKMNGAFNEFVEIVGNITIHALDKDAAVSYKQFIMKMPKHFKQKNPGKTLASIDLSTVKKADRLSPGTVNSHLAVLASFYKYAANHVQHLPKENPFTGMLMDDPVRSQDKKDPFSLEQLNKIFGSPIYQGCEGDSQKVRLNPGKLIIKDAKYWVPLLGLYTGARLGELCQLYCSDIRQVGGIWVIDINETADDKRIKTEASRRLVPIHSKLIQAGFLDYHKSQVKNAQQRLFPELTAANNGSYSAYTSKWFSRLLVRVQAKTKKTSFHSFRHTFIDIMRNETNVPEDVRTAIVGHENGNRVHSSYGGPLGVKKMSAAVEKLKYKGLATIRK